MARPKTVINPDDMVIDIDMPQVAQDQQQQSGRLDLILRQFGDGLPFDPTRYEVIIRDHLARSASEALAAGRALIVVREALPHGDWMPFLERLRLDKDIAGRMMRAAFKFSDEKTAKLVSAAGNKSKLFELMVLDDEEIAELADGGTVAGLELDDIERKGTRELRAMVRDYQEEKKATEKLLSDKNTRIDNLTGELTRARTRIESATVDEQVQELMTAVSGECLGLESQITIAMHGAIKQLIDIKPDAVDAIAGHISMVQQALDSLRAEFGIGGVSSLVPAWAKE